MSVFGPEAGLPLPFFLSMPAPCPYLRGREERKLFTRLSGEASHDFDANSFLTQAGFRRSHSIVYRPACLGCEACVPVRAVAQSFYPSRTQKKVWKRSADLTMEVASLRATEEQYTLFQKYEKARHADSDMASMSFDDFSLMIKDGFVDTALYQWRTPQGALVAAMLVDRVADGFSAIYSFFDPDQKRRSLGTFMVMALIAEAQAQQAPYVYLGYWIEASPKMAYKKNFTPLERLTGAGWQTFTQPDETFS